MSPNQPNGSYITSCPWHRPAYNPQCSHCINAVANSQTQRNPYNSQFPAHSTPTPPHVAPPPPFPQFPPTSNSMSFPSPVSASNGSFNAMQVNAPRSSMYPPVTPNFLVPQAWNTGNQQYLPVRPVGSPGVTQTTLNHRKKVPMFFCPVSGCESRGFTEKHNFIYHMRSHEGIKPFECPRCGKPFRSQSDLTRHLKKSKKRCDSQKPY